MGVNSNFAWQICQICKCLVFTRSMLCFNAYFMCVSSVLDLVGVSHRTILMKNHVDEEPRRRCCSQLLLPASTAALNSPISANWRPAYPRPRLHLKSYRLLQRCPVRGHWRRHSATTGSASRRSATNHRRQAKWPHHGNIERHSSLAAHVSAHYVQNCADDITTVSMADHQCTSATSVHRSSLFSFVLGFALLTMMTWLYHVLGPRVMVRAVSASRHPRFGTCYHLISRTVVLVANSSSRALRLGSLCKPTHKRRLWELCLSGALQILDLIWWFDDLIWFEWYNQDIWSPVWQNCMSCCRHQETIE